MMSATGKALAVLALLAAGLSLIPSVAASGIPMLAIAVMMLALGLLV